MKNLGDFRRRDDLCRKGQTRVMCCDYGVIVKTGKNWYASIDERSHLIGFDANDTLAQPTVGPFKTAQDALSAYIEAENCRSEAS